MQVLFAHDHIFAENSTGGVFSPGKLPYAVWNRYLEHCDQLWVVARKFPSVSQIAIEKFSISSGPGVLFKFVPNICSIKGSLLHRAKAKEILEGAMQNVDAVVARLPSEIGLIACASARALGKPLAVEVVACAWDALWNYGQLATQLYAPVMFYRTRCAVANASHVIYVTQKFLQRRFPPRGFASYASDVLIPDQPEEIFSQRQARWIDNGRQVVIGQLGSLAVKYKGFDTALSAIAQLKNRYDIIFRIAGPGSDAKLRQITKNLGIEGVVRFDGLLTSGKMVMQWLDGIDIFLQPSYVEGLPRALVEAMSRGCASVGSTAGGIPELLEQSLLHRPGSVRQLTDRIEPFLMNRKLIELHGLRNFEKAKEYQLSVLEARIKNFWASFFHEVSEKSGYGNSYEKGISPHSTHNLLPQSKNIG